MGAQVIFQYPNKFSPMECDKIIALGEAAESHYVKAGTGESANLKEVEVSFIHCDIETQWIFSRVIPLLAPWPISRLEDLQFSIYGEGGCCDWHIDHEEDTNQGAGRDRIVNAIVQLSDPGDYTGGDLEAKVGLTIHQPSRERGSVLVLDKEIWHRVAPLTGGIRKSLVCWGLK